MAEAAVYVGGGVDERWIRTRVHSPGADPNHLRSIKIGRRRLIHPDDVDALVASKMSDPNRR